MTKLKTVIQLFDSKNYQDDVKWLKSVIQLFVIKNYQNRGCRQHSWSHRGEGHLVGGAVGGHRVQVRSVVVVTSENEVGTDVALVSENVKENIFKTLFKNWHLVARNKTKFPNKQEESKKHQAFSNLKV